MEVHARESLAYLQKTVGRNVDITGDFCESSEKGEESSRESFCHLKEYIYHHGHHVARNMNVKGHPDEASDRNEFQCYLKLEERPSL